MEKYIIDLYEDWIDGEYLRLPARIAGTLQWIKTKTALTPYTEDSAYAHGYTEAESKYREIRDELEKQAYQRGYETAKHECEDCGLNNYERGYKTAVGVYEGGYKKAIEDARLEGMNDAWEAARKIASDNAGQNYSIFGQHFTVEILNTHSASEAIEKIRQYKEEQEKKDGVWIANGTWIMSEANEPSANTTLICSKCGYAIKIKPHETPALNYCSKCGDCKKPKEEKF